MRDLEQLQKDSAKLSTEEQLKLAEYLIARARRQKRPDPKQDIGEFYGTIKFPEDALAFQHRVRAEWDR